ncbi:MAG: nucleotidyltransferase [Cyanothece sp. SIO2G6]|nr:nucleotidyltransferase [Cyanothece sp. SIO2G6]
MPPTAIPLPMDFLQNFCQDWRIFELSLFGSILRDDFRPDSDIDILVEFDSDARWGLLDHVKMQQELASALGRDVDLISKRAIANSSNWIRRDNILSTAQVVYRRSNNDQ